MSIGGGAWRGKLCAVTMADAAKIAFQISLFVVILGYGLTAQFSDVLYVLKRPGLLARSLLAVIVLAPALAVLLVWAIDLRPQVAIALVTLAISPLPPLLPRRGGKAGGQIQYGLGLVIVLAVLAVPVIALAATLLGMAVGRSYLITPWAIAQLLAVSVLAPLLAGMAVRARWPSAAARLSKPIEHAQRWALPVAGVVLLITSASDMWKLVGESTLWAVVGFVVGAFAIGDLLGGPDHDSRILLAFATSCRHPATALAIASANFPNADERGAVALYGLVTTAVSLLYHQWWRRRRSKAD